MNRVQHLGGLGASLEHMMTARREQHAAPGSTHPEHGWEVLDPWTGEASPSHPGDGGGSGPSRILVPYNGTATAQRALDVVGTLIGGRSATVWVLYVRPWDIGRAGNRT